jgi:hypothetical protein
MRVVLMFEFDETLAKQHNFDAEYFVNSIQDHLQADLGDMMGWHNNDPDINWFTVEELLEEGYTVTEYMGVVFPILDDEED